MCMVAGYSADSGYPRSVMSAVSAVIRPRPTPRPRYSGATVTPDTPAIGTALPSHHWRMSWNSAVPTIRSPSKAARAAPSAMTGSAIARRIVSSCGPKALILRSRWSAWLSPAVSERTTMSAKFLHDLVRHRVVGVDVLHVVGVLERVDQPEHLARLLLVQVHLDAGQERHVRRLVVDLGFLQRLAGRDQVGRLRDHLERLAEVVDLLGAGVQDGGQHVVLAGAVLLDDDHALAVEQVAHRAGVGHRAAVAGERDAHIRRRSVPVVGQALDQDRHAAGTVALIGDVLVLGAARLRAAAALDRPVDVVVRDRVLLGLLDRVIQGRVARWIATAGARSDLDVLDQLGEKAAALCIDHRLLVLGGGPLGVAA